MSGAEAHGLWGKCGGSAFGPYEGTWPPGLGPPAEGDVLGRAGPAPASRALWEGSGDEAGQEQTAAVPDPCGSPALGPAGRLGGGRSTTSRPKRRGRQKIKQKQKPND